MSPQEQSVKEAEMRAREHHGGLYNALNLEVAKVAAKDSAKPELNGVFFTPQKSVATDSFRLLEISTPSGVKPEDFPVCQGKSAMRGFRPFIAPASEVAKLKIIGNKATASLPILNHIAVSFRDEHQVSFLTTNLEVAETKTMRLIDGTFPPYEQVIPQGQPVLEINLNAAYLAELATILGKFNRLMSVKFKFYGNDKPVLMEAGNEIQKGRALLMPIRDV